jgi:signal transduction histidine kinase
MLLELARGTGAEWTSWIQHLCQFEADVLRVQRVSFWTLDDSISSMTCDAGYVAASREFEHGAVLLASAVPEFFEAIREARALNVEDVRVDPRVRGLGDYCASRGVSSLLDIPVWAEGRLAGVLCHEHVGPARHWKRAEQDFAVGVGQVVASALAARAHTRAQAAAQRSTFLDAVSRAVVTSLDPHEIGQRAIALVVPRLADVCVIWMLNREGGLEPLAHAVADPRRDEAIVRVHRALSRNRRQPNFAMRVFRQRQSVLLPDVPRAILEVYDFSPAERTCFDELGITASMGIPLEVGGTAIGAMMFHAAGRHYDADDRALAEDIAARVAAALHNARMYSIAQDAIRARDDFLVLVAHELRTPLTALQLRTDSLLHRARSSGRAEDTKRSEAIAQDVRRFADVVEHVLEASTVRAEGVKLSHDLCDLAQIVADCVAREAERAQRAGSTIAFHKESSIVHRCDRERVQRVVLCLLDNAIKFGERKPIEVSLRRDGTQAVLTVRDHGAGIAPERLPHLFEPFERAVPMEHFPGLGMGLYIARAVVEAHGGTISAHSTVGEGTTLVVRLPLSSDVGAP